MSTLEGAFTRRDALGVIGGLTLVPARVLGAQDPDAAFISAANDYIGQTLQANPESATATGDHRYDGRLTDRSPAGRERVLAVHRNFLKQLDSIDSGHLKLQNRIDYEIARLRAESAVWQSTTLREFEWNPMNYNPGDPIYLLLERDFAPLETRLDSLRDRLDAVPEALAAAKSNLRNPPRIFTETAIAQNKGTLALVRQRATEQAANVPGATDTLAPSQQRAATALEDWGRWLETELLPRSTRDFRLGRELFTAKLHYTLDSALSVTDLRLRAREELRDARDAIYRTASQLARSWSPSADVSDPAATVRMVLDKLAAERPSGQDVIAKAESAARAATEFVRSKALVSVPSKPLKIIPMPEYQRGVSVATTWSPGPLEKRGETFMNISPPPANWSQAQVDSFFREYNNSMLYDLVVHEGMPGHYLQLAHANQYRGATIVRSLFRSGSFTEGWATYAERVMAEHGFGGPEVRMQQLKMWLRSIINTLLDIGIHTEDMSEQQAMDLMMNDGYQERSEAAGKWRRAQLSSTQLSTYFTGAIELLAFRDWYTKKHGPVRDWRRFHDTMLSFGSPPPRYLKELMA